MNTFKSLRFEIKVDGDSQYFVIRGEFHDSGYVWFVLTGSELERWLNWRMESFKDGYHSMDCVGDICRFYDLEFPNTPSGTIQVKYHAVVIPYHVRKMMLRYARLVWVHLKASKQYCHEVDVTARASKWVKLYGCGTGQVKLKMDVTCPPSAETQVDRLMSIARNTTSAYYQTATLDLSKDGNGFYFQVRTPRGRCSMVGGLINHGTQENPDWSIHT